MSTNPSLARERRNAHVRKLLSSASPLRYQAEMVGLLRLRADGQHLIEVGMVGQPEMSLTVEQAKWAIEALKAGVSEANLDDARHTRLNNTTLPLLPGVRING